MLAKATLGVSLTKSRIWTNGFCYWTKNGVPPRPLPKFDEFLPLRSGL